ncbi:M14 family zinc carboxypeptidase [Mycetocola saprophilus]|uniref:M14 family zinc carboxypeptidase n=1 Tax=Mycetocola saprophilus TaxID=76636 RepID=UPI003BEF88A8
MALHRLITASALSTVLIGGLLLAPQTAAVADESGPLLLTVPTTAANQVSDLDVVEANDAGLVVLADPATESLLATRGVRIISSAPYATSIGHSQTQNLRARSFAAAAAPTYPLPGRLAGTEYETYFGGYRTAAAYDKFSTDIAANYPELVQRVDFGESWEKKNGKGGSNLVAIRITGDVKNQPAPTDGQEGRPRFVLVAQAHAREIITSELAWRYATELLNGYGVDPQVTALLDSTEVWINFQNNPDSIRQVETALGTSPVNAAGDATPPNSSKAWQRKNANNTLFAPTSTNWSSQQHGIDLNRNWAFKWGGASTSTNPNAVTYLGPSPASEPETAQLATLLTQLFGEYRTESTTAAPDTRKGSYINLHSYSDYVIYPYAYDKNDAVPNLAPIKASAFRQSFASGFQTGKAGEILYDNAGNDIDWIYSQLGVPAYTYEIGTAATGGFFPAYTRVADFWAKVSPGIHFAAEAAYAPYTATLGGVVTEVSAERADNGSVRITGTASDDVYGKDPRSAARRPAVTNIVEAEAALAVDRNSIAKTVPLVVDAPGTETGFSGTIAVDRTNSDFKKLFVRAKNGTGQWGPWRAADVAAIDAPVYQGQDAYTITAGVAQNIQIPVTSVIPVEYGIIGNSLPKGLSLDAETGVISGTATEAGTSRPFFHINNGAGSVEREIPFTVEPAALSTFELGLSAAAPKQGDTITITALGTDEFGNQIADFSDRVVLTSSVASDVIVGNTVRFQHASPHTITATFEGVSSSILVEVTPVAVDGGTTPPSTVPAPGSSALPVDNKAGVKTPGDGIANTGAEIGGLLVVLTLLLGAGTALVVRRRRSSEV